MLALNLVADDYVKKPFGILQLLARSKALLRRSHEVVPGYSDQNKNIQQAGTFGKIRSYVFAGYEHIITSHINRLRIKIALKYIF